MLSTYVQVTELAVCVMLDVLNVHPEVAVAGTQVVISVVICVQCVGVVYLDTVEQDVGAGATERLPLPDRFPGGRKHKAVSSGLETWVMGSWSEKLSCSCSENCRPNGISSKLIT